MRNKPLFFILIFLAAFITAHAQPTIEWQTSLGGSSGEYPTSIQQTADGGYIVAGGSCSDDGDVSGHHGAITYNHNDFWIVKLDNTGYIEWEESLGGTRNDQATSIQQTADGGYIAAGWTNSNDGDVSGNHGSYDGWIVKLDSNGTVQWKKILGGTADDNLGTIRQTADGGYIAMGLTDSNDGDVSGYHGGNGYDSWIVKLNNSGIIQWQKCLGGTEDDGLGRFQHTNDGGYIAAGYSYSNNGDVSGGHHGDSTYADCWIVKLDATAAIQWQKSLGGTGYDGGGTIQQTTDGGYILAGFSNSIDGDVSGNHGGPFLGDLWIVKLDGAGAIQWQKCLGGTDDDVASSIYQTADGGYIVGGSSESNDGDVSGNHGGSFPQDCWIVKLNGSGNIQWQECLGGTDLDGVRSIQQTTDGGNIILGASLSNNGDVSGSHGSGDYWIVKLSSEVGLESLAGQNEFNIYPNPVTSKLAVSSLQLTDKETTISIYNLPGQNIYNLSGIKNPKSEIFIDVSSWVPGIYFIELKTRYGTTVKKFIKE